MKKVTFVILTALIAFFVGNVSAQSNAFPKGKIGVNAGFGFGANTWGAGFMPTFNLAGDYAIKDVINDGGSISLGAFFGIGGNKSENNFRLGVRGALHYTFVDKLDTYGGIAMGLKHSKGKVNDSSNGYGSLLAGWDDDDEGGKETHFTFIPIFAGARYMFTDQLGAFSEVAISKFAYFQIGLSVMF